MREFVGVVLTFTRFVPDGAGMSKVQTQWWYGRSVSRAVSLSLEGGRQAKFRVQRLQGRTMKCEWERNNLAPTRSDLIVL